jgi:hypothetical protein
MNNNEIEVIDEVNNKVYTIPENEDIVFHPLNPDQAVVIKDVLEKYGQPDKSLGKRTIIFKKNGETMVLYKKDTMPNKLIQKESALDSNHKKFECQTIGLTFIDNKPCICLCQDENQIQNKNIYYFKYNGKKELLELVETIYIFIRKHNLK